MKEIGTLFERYWSGNGDDWAYVVLIVATIAVVLIALREWRRK